MKLLTDRRIARYADYRAAECLTGKVDIHVEAMAQKLVEYGRTHRDFRTVLGYATDRINDKEIAIIMNKAREIGKKLAVCCDNREVSEFLSMMTEQE